MNLESIPEDVWTKLTAAAMADINSVRNTLYNDIYAKWSEGKVSYHDNLAEETDAGWPELVVEWKKIEGAGGSLGGQLDDDSVGGAHVQGGDGPDSGVRLWEKYNGKARGDRFQFVVTEGGGMVLFNRMRRACQQFMIDKLGSDPEQFAVRGWKVFGEEKQKGRSDSCCVYTAVKYTDQQLKDLVEGYVWPAVKDLVDADFVPIGFHKVCGHPLWAMPMPTSEREKAEYGKTSRGSAGGLMGNILQEAYIQGAEGIPADDADALTVSAKKKAAEIVARLYA